MKIEKRVEAVKVKVKEKATWVKENPKKVFKMALEGLLVIGPSAVACYLGKRCSEQNEEIELKDQQLSDKDQQLSDYSDAIDYFQKKEIENQRTIKQQASELLRLGSSSGGKKMNSFRGSNSGTDSDYDDL